MSHPSAHPDDPHYVTRNSWLRAAVLGANDGIVSVSSLVVGVAAAIPVLAAVVAPSDWIVPTVWAVTVGSLAGLGALGAKFGGAPMWPAMVRVMGWGVLAMAVTTGVGYLFGVNI